MQKAAKRQKEMAKVTEEEKSIALESAHEVRNATATADGKTAHPKLETKATKSTTTSKTLMTSIKKYVKYRRILKTAFPVISTYTKYRCKFRTASMIYRIN